MPFTPAHPAIIIPLIKSKRFSATALIAGSMVPDFEFFFQMREVKNVGHHWYGILLFDLPFATLLCFLFHNVMRNLIITQLPAALQNRFLFATSFNWNQYAVKNKAIVFCSLLTGIISHLFWDGFTHHDGFFVELLPALAAATWLQAYQIPLYFLLQIVFSFIGLLVVCYCVYKLPTHTTVNFTRQRKHYWSLFFLLMGLTFTVRVILWPQYNSFWSLFIAVIGSICYSWIAISVVFNFSNLKRILI
ncbi:MAG: DUF4184 family protein [Chitinophagaceae bacterium]|nr:DUF4184 family protein [Chitinophagaceae bacterium]